MRRAVHGPCKIFLSARIANPESLQFRFTMAQHRGSRAGHIAEITGLDSGSQCSRKPLHGEQGNFRVRHSDETHRRHPGEAPGGSPTAIPVSAFPWRCRKKAPAVDRGDVPVEPVMTDALPSSLPKSSRKTPVFYLRTVACVSRPRSSSSNSGNNTGSRNSTACWH